MAEELDTVKDQVDVLREQGHTFTRYTTDISDIRSRLVMLEQGKEDMLGEMLVTHSTRPHNMSVISNDSRDSIDNIYVTNVSQTNNQLDETTVLPSQV